MDGDCDNAEKGHRLVGKFVAFLDVGEAGTPPREEDIPLLAPPVGGSLHFSMKQTLFFPMIFSNVTSFKDGASIVKYVEMC